MSLSEMVYPKKTHTLIIIRFPIKQLLESIPQFKSHPKIMLSWLHIAICFILYTLSSWFKSQNCLMFVGKAPLYIILVNSTSPPQKKNLISHEIRSSNLNHLPSGNQTFFAGKFSLSSMLFTTIYLLEIPQRTNKNRQTI